MLNGYFLMALLATSPQVLTRSQPSSPPVVVQASETLGNKLRRLDAAAERSNPFIDAPLSLPPAWSSGAYFHFGETILNGGHIYLCGISGTTGSTPPTGTGPAPMSDGSAVWYYLEDPRTQGSSPLVPTRSDYNGTTPPGCPAIYHFDALNMNQVIDFRGGAPFISGAGADSIQLATSMIGTFNQCGQQMYSFETDSPKVSIGMVYPQAFRTIIDGRYLDYGAELGGVGGGPTWRTFDFTNAGGRKVRKFTLEFGYAAPLVGVAVDSDSHVWKPHSSDHIRAIAVGDSLTQGGNGFPTLNFWPTIVGHQLGWDDCRAAGVGGTGYVNPGQFVNWPSRIQSDVIDQKPDVVIFYGSVNDSSATNAQITANALSCFQAIRNAFPSVPIFVVGVPALGTTDPTLAISHENAVFAAASQVSLTYPIPVSTDVEPWFLGSGNITAPKGDGNADVYTSGDNIHPDDAGIRFTAMRILEGIRKWIQTMP